MKEETDKITQHGNWFIKNFPAFLFPLALILYNFIEEWINIYVYIGILITVLTNFLFFTSKSVKVRTWFAGSNSWLKANLIAFGYVVASYITVTFIVKELTFLGSLVPESVSSIFPIILITGLIFCFVGFGFYLLEKSTGN